MAEIDYNTVIAAMRKGDPGAPGAPGANFTTGILSGDLDSYKTDGFYKMEAGGDDVKNFPPTLAQKYCTMAVYTTNGVNRLIQVLYPTATGLGGKVFYTRILAGSSWSPWRAITAQRVDNSAGKTVYTWDDTTNSEVLIYGDTGVRNITSMLQGQSTTAADPSVLVHRNDTLVTLYLENLQPVSTSDWTPLLTLPVGFRPRLRNPQRIWIGANSAGANRSAFLYTSGALTIFGAQNTDTMRANLTFPTGDAWPTELPGVPL